MRILLFFSLCAVFAATSARAAEIEANATLPRGTVLASSDITITAATPEATAEAAKGFVGMELTRTVYAGHQITRAHVRQPVLVKRNKVVTMLYQYGPMTITTYGRALGEGSMGDVVELMNVNSRKKVHAVVIGQDRVKVQ